MSRIVSLIVFLVITLPSFGQKVKYKDLIILLNAKQYETAEPFLKRYLKENDGNPNAYLFMGIIFYEKASANDVLKHTEMALANSDSAVIFFDKAYAMITEKELKRNDENYQMYSRRDMRTGEFGIKLSDVRLDLESKVKSIKDRKDRIREMKKYFLLAESLYSNANESYKNLHTNYGSNREFLLRSDEPMVASLNQIIVRFDSMISTFNSYKTVSKQVGKTTYNQIIDLQEIIDFKRDGSTLTSFMDDDLKIWDYKRWASATLETIEKEINPMRDNLISFDISLNKLREKIVKDSVSVKADLDLLTDRLLPSRLKKFDSDPLPLAIFSMKRVEMEYLSDKIIHKSFRDSANVKLRLTSLEIELDELRRLDSISSGLVRRDLDAESLNYNHFISKSYGAKAVLASLINTTQAFAKRELLKEEIEWEATMQAFKWAIVGRDSIPLYFETNRELKFKPLVIVDEKYTIGFNYKDSLAIGYLYSITPARVPDIKATFPVDQPNFKKRDLPIIKCLSIVGGDNQVYFAVIYSEGKVEDKFPVTIAKVYRSDGLAWSSNFKLEMIPTELNYSVDTGELSIKTTNTAGESKMVVIDKNGKKLQ